ncbi:unnamed protein product [Clonostachys byssicola]|uniref:Zn(2)-C6 fungal-type domain-containing protein n=1 Tax=Clonostachys byssicola TaxID=160290 RepID=A0A9N9U1L4_9HYPO|nr:unnamed protein product [Clonostachys byssicola]
MPGIPRSRACQDCKRKKIKLTEVQCDQNWPACGQCLRSNLACQGPTSLAKFVHRTAPPVQRRTRLESPEPQSQNHRTKYAKLVQRGQGPTFENGTSISIMRLQAPRASPPSTSAERLAIKLNMLLRDGLDNGVCRLMSYLPHVRQRLGHSTCLRDCTAVFCSAWADYRRRAPAESLISLKLFGKALRSLGKAVQDNKMAFTAETLGAMALLERTESLFGVGPVKHLVKHLNGIKYVLQHKGPPNLDDGLDVLLTFENQGALFALSLTGDENYMLKENWEKIAEKAAREKEIARGQECFPADFDMGQGVVAKWPDWVQITKSLRTNPGKMESKKLELLNKLHSLDGEMDVLMAGVTEKATSLGFLREIPDAELFALSKYEFGSLFFAQAFAGTLLLQMVIRRFIYDIGVIYDSPEAFAFSRYRDICVQLWMILPYMTTQDPLSAMDLLNRVYLSIEAADEYEKNCFLEAFLALDEYQKRLPADKTQLDKSLRSMAAGRFGRAMQQHA